LNNKRNKNSFSVQIIAYYRRLNYRCNSEATSYPSGIFSGVVDVATAGYLWVEATVTIRKGYSGWYHCGF
jgi:hypothetical protein